MTKPQRSITPARAVILASCLAFGSALLSPAMASPPAQLVVFGDSLSDPGNAFALVGGTATPPDYATNPLLIPSQPYAKGGHHFTNGETWIEQLARTWKLAANANPAFRSSSAKALNFAVGGARAGASGDAHLDVQVGSFLQRSAGVASADALYVVAIGGNDVRAAAEAGETGAPPIIAAGVQGIAGQIGALYGAGARRFFVWNAPDLGLSPALLALGEEAAGGASFLSQLFNFHLEEALAALDGLPGISIARFDAFGTLHAMVAGAEDLGLSNVTTACITPHVPPFHCKNPDDYLFWDGIHPTRAAHAIIAHEAAQALGQ